MPRVIVTEGAVAGLDRCRKFLLAKNADAAQRAADTIAKHFLLLETSPEIGRPFEDDPALRELVIAFGAAGYAAVYRYVPGENAVFILAFRHLKEAG
ncbi:MAG TPA: type II toxin-antitoxin system RelE/ParE family toxin [Sinorhizobium sp.]|nr:type II toxin-antitoxin system RelE/ParE family toxin [Sinorhizobium sp.]